MGKQKCTDTGPLTRKRMENFDSEEVIPRTEKFIKQAQKDGKPFFVWLNTSRMHIYTHLDEKWRYAAEIFLGNR